MKDISKLKGKILDAFESYESSTREADRETAAAKNADDIPLGSRVRLQTNGLEVVGTLVPSPDKERYALLHSVADGVISVARSDAKMVILEPARTDFASGNKSLGAEVVKALMALASYITERNRQAEVDRQFQKILNGQSDIVRAVSETLDQRFQESDISGELGLLDTARRHHEEGDWDTASELAERAADRLKQRDIFVRAAPFFLAAASIAIDSQSRRGSAVERMARDWANHIDELIPAIEEAIKRRISVRTSGFRSEFRVDGRVRAVSVPGTTFPNRTQHEVKRLGSPLVPSLRIAREKWRSLERDADPKYGLALAGYRTIGQSTQCAISDEHGMRIGFASFLAVIEVDDFAVEIPDEIDRSLPGWYTLPQYTEVINVNPYGIAFILRPEDKACFPQGGYEATRGFAAQNGSVWPTEIMQLREFERRFNGVEKLTLYKAGLEGTTVN